MEGVRDQQGVKMDKRSDMKFRIFPCSSLKSESSSIDLGDQHINKTAKRKRAKMEKRRSKMDKRTDTKFRIFPCSSLNSKSSSNETLAMDCASMPDDGQLYYDDNFEGVLDKELHSKMEEFPHEVEVDVLRWYVRRCALKRVKGCFVALIAKELQFATSLIEKNASNFHAWSHRKWVLQTFGGVYTEKIWDEELVYCNKMVDKDSYNCLVWDHRYFVVTRCLLEYYEAYARSEKKLGQEIDFLFRKKRDEEEEFAIKVIMDGEAGNHCPWSYVRSLYTVHSGSMTLNSSMPSVVLWVLKENANLKDLDWIDKRGIINALNMLIDLLKYGFRIEDRVGKKICKALEALSPNTPPLPNKIPFMLVNLERDLAASGLVWRNAGMEFLFGTSFVRNFKMKANKVWRTKAVGECFCAPATLPAENNEENDANAYIPLPEEPKLCNVRLHFPDKHKVRRDFLLTDPVKLLWSFCNSELKEKKPFCLTLSILGALSTLDFDDKRTFGELGLSVLRVSVTWK